ncbi:hypothetical protein E1B28_009973 [Marasmius oreades]|uniref:Uncharacterized protein n=1 Tax=Marasmius oreades TaxID=181124 RepID=A0A9P7RW50_9AGAR|nr:uncharacterized protein E1B28_009973 [Marasmius oreades]KAG7090894.1 hypothetical protein E1B28_009973 [Marasmius oreades]
MRSELAQFLSQHYNSVKLAHPNEGRRKWKLRVLENFWASNPAPPSDSDSFRDEELSNEDEDPFDSVIENVAGGVVIRTDFSDEDSWRSIHEKLKEAEKEITGNDNPKSNNDTTTMDENNTDADMKEEDEEEEGEDGKLIKTINPESPNERALFENISNLTALRLFNDVDIRPSPSLHPDARRISPPHRLIDQSGWQEIYTGVDIWVYDTKSNADSSVRLVSLQGDVYGTATGDSWRAQASHIYDLQFNMLTGMKINFGGMDRWDYSERKRNLDEAVIPVV